MIALATVATIIVMVVMLFLFAFVAPFNRRGCGNRLYGILAAPYCCARRAAYGTSEDRAVAPADFRSDRSTGPTADSAAQYGIHITAICRATRQ